MNVTSQLLLAELIHAFTKKLPGSGGFLIGGRVSTISFPGSKTPDVNSVSLLLPFLPTS
jgi:hypothetical protein